MTRTNLYWLIAMALTAAAFAVSALAYSILPERIPTHWNLEGKVDGYGPRWTLFLLPATMIGFLVFFRFLPALSPKNFQVDSFRTTYLFVMAAVVGLFACLHGVILFATWQQVSKVAQPIAIGRTMLAGVFLFLALIGNVLGKVRRNFYIGVRVPWTLASDRVWNDTHRLAAWTLVAGSVVGFILVVAGVSLLLPIAVLVVSALIPVVYSFVHYKQLERRGAL
jgi:uncharacterized membrane protein